MKAFAYLTALLVTLPAHGAEGSAAFRDAFHAYVDLQRLEEKYRINEHRSGLEEGERLNQARKLSAQVTAARIDFQAFLRSEEKELSPWEKSVLKHAGSPRLAANDKTALVFLTSTYAKAAPHWSPAEWQCASDWFGAGVTDSFLKITFQMEEAGATPSPAASVKTIFWVTDPAGLLLHKDEAARGNAKRATATASLRKNGFTVEEVQVHPFTSLDDQAQELEEQLVRRLAGHPAVLVSAGHASAVLLRTFDLNPHLLAENSIRGWINVNGKLFGDNQVERAPASLTKVDRQFAEARRELLPLREERLEPQMPLSPRFPIVNLVSFGGEFRPGISLRDSLVPEGKSLYLKNTDAVDSIAAALPLLDGHAPPAGQRDFATESSF